MAKTMRKKNLKIQMLAGNSLNSFLNSRSEENSTVSTCGDMNYTYISVLMLFGEIEILATVKSKTKKI